jgi:hypothetical protein
MKSLFLYLRSSARIFRTDRVRNETIRTRLGVKKAMLQETEEQQLGWYGHVMWRTAELLGRLWNVTHREKGGRAGK